MLNFPTQCIHCDKVIEGEVMYWLESDDGYESFPVCSAECSAELDELDKENKAIAANAENRQDTVDNAIYQMLNDLAKGKEIEWDIELIGKVREVISTEFEARGIMPEREFYP